MGPAVSPSDQSIDVNSTHMDSIEIDARKNKGLEIPVEQESTPVPPEPQPGIPTPPPSLPPETTPSLPPETTIADLDAQLPKNMMFVPGDGSNVSTDAVWVGNTSLFSNVRSYVCRVQKGNNYLLGSLKSNGKCYVSDGSAASGETTFKFLVYTTGDVKSVMGIGNGNGSVPSKGVAMGLYEGRAQYLCYVAAQNDFFIGAVDSQSNGCVFADFGSGKANAPVPGKSSSGYSHAVRK